MNTIDLTNVYRQRVGVAVAAARALRRAVVLRVGGSGDDSYIVWYDRSRHVIASGSERGMKSMLPAIQEEFARQLRAAECEGGAVADE